MKRRSLQLAAASLLCATLPALAADSGLFLTNGSFDAPLPPKVDWMPLNYQSTPPVAWQNGASECEGFGSACGTVSFVTKAVADDPAVYGVVGSEGHGLAVAMYNQAILSQSFTVGAGEGGQYMLHWQDALATKTNSLYQAGLPVMNNAYSIVLDNVTLGQYQSGSGQFTAREVGLNLSEGTHVLKLVGLDRPTTTTAGSYNQYFFLNETHVVVLDNVSISAVPELQTMWMSVVGLLFLGALRRNRRARGGDPA